VGKTKVAYVTFLHNVSCQKLLKSADVSRSYSKNNIGTFFWDTVYCIVQHCISLEDGKLQFSDRQLQIPIHEISVFKYLILSLNSSRMGISSPKCSILEENVPTKKEFFFPIAYTLGEGGSFPSAPHATSPLPLLPVIGTVFSPWLTVGLGKSGRKHPLEYCTDRAQRWNLYLGRISLFSVAVWLRLRPSVKNPARRAAVTSARDPAAAVVHTRACRREVIAHRGLDELTVTDWTVLDPPPAVTSLSVSLCLSICLSVCLSVCLWYFPYN